MSFLDEVRARARGRGARIVYPEGIEERAMRAAAILRDQDLARPMLLGPEPEIRGLASRLGVSLDGIAVRDPSKDHSRGELEAAYLELRRHKGGRHRLDRALLRLHAPPRLPVLLHPRQRPGRLHRSGEGSRAPRPRGGADPRRRRGTSPTRSPSASQGRPPSGRSCRGSTGR